MSDHRYYGLISSLPYLGAGDRTEFHDARVPISRDNLKSRLKGLAPKDYEQIQAIIDFHQSLYAVTTLTDRQVCDRLARTLGTLQDPEVINLFVSTSEIWLIMEALHQRQLGRNDTPLPPLPLAPQIRRNWSHPDFMLAGRYPWIVTAREMMERNQILELEKYVDQIRWRIANQASLKDPFGFVSVVAYVGKWEILYRWHQVDLDIGLQRFNELVESVLSKV